MIGIKLLKRLKYYIRRDKKVKMKILLVNKFHYLKGGSEKYYFELAKLLKEHGHQVAFFSMQDEKNITTGDKEYFVEKIDLNTGSKLKALDVIFSKTNYEKMKEALEDFKPDIVHINNFQRQLSASIIKAIKEKNISIVFTAHDVQAICPAITMMDNNKNICEKCIHGKYLNCIKKKCNKDSTLKSIIGAIEGYYYRINKIYTKKIDYIITPSEFYKIKLIEDGISGDKIEAIHNFVELSKYDLKTLDEGYALYFGRLSKEKGILNLINAFSKMDRGALYIAGEGPEKETIEKIIKENNMQDRVKLLGFLNSDEMKEYIRKCKFVVVPSIWYENCPYSVMETLAIGKPVIGADIGGIPELVRNNECGLIYDYDNTTELYEKMKRMFEDKELTEKFGKNAKKLAINLYGKELYYKKIFNIYEKLVKGDK